MTYECVFMIPDIESFHLIPYNAYFGMVIRRCGTASNMGVVDGCGHYGTLDDI